MMGAMVPSQAGRSQLGMHRQRLYLGPLPHLAAAPVCAHQQPRGEAAAVIKLQPNKGTALQLRCSGAVAKREPCESAAVQRFHLTQPAKALAHGSWPGTRSCTHRPALPASRVAGQRRQPWLASSAALWSRGPATDRVGRL